MFKIKDIMVTPVVTVEKNTPLPEVIHKLMKGAFTGMPVVNTKGAVVGIVTELDILKALDDGATLALLKASDIMSSNPLTVTIETPIYEVIKILITKHVLRLPVTNNGRLVGIISRRDILRGVLQEMSEAQDIDFISDAAKALFSAKTPRDVLMVLVERIGSYFDAERCSVISVDEKRNVATVHTSYEDPEMKELEIDLSKYPEILRAFQTGEHVLLRDAAKDPMMKTVLRWLKDIDLKSIMVCPISSKDEILGTLYFRTRTKYDLSNKDLQISKILSAMAADALKAIVKEKTLLHQYKDSEKKIAIDDLTGLYNRRFFNVRLSEEFGMSARHATPLACIMFDLDNFKEINDTLGHQAGDNVLKRFASTLKNSVRISDIVARYAGDEFVMLLPMSDTKGALREAERIKQILDDLDYGDGVGKLSVSIGVACYPCPGVKKPEDLIKNADAAMYKAKRTGKNRVSIYMAA
jgi:diguanylate cyclase (GGDEF)-like protein